jgi:hypothetical protein
MKIGSNGETRGVSKTMNFRIQPLLFSFFIINKVILEGGLDFLIIPISSSGFSLYNLRSIVILPLEVASVINVLRVFVCLFPLQFQPFHSS